MACYIYKDIKAINPHGLRHLCFNLDLAVRGAIAFFIYSNFINMPSPMKSASVTNNSNCTTTSAHETIFLSWRSIAKLLTFMSFGLLECDNKNDVIGYVKVLILLMSAFILAGLEGGAL